MNITWLSSFNVIFINTKRLHIGVFYHPLDWMLKYTHWPSIGRHDFEFGPFQVWISSTALDKDDKKA